METQTATPTQQALITQLATTKYVLERNLEGLTHEDSLVSPAPAGNCANWILGHIVGSRSGFVALLGQPMYPENRFADYSGRKDARFDPAAAERFEDLLDCYHSMQEPLLRGIASLTPEAMAEPAPFSPTGNPEETIGSLMATFAFHEAYHAGQTAILRRVVGKEGAIKAPE